MSKQRLYLALLLDRSGSMIDHKQETISAINSYVDQTKELYKGRFTLTQFDSEAIDIVHDGIKIKDAPHLTGETYQPRSLTPLLDAIGQTVTRMDVAGFDNVIFCIITDGLENASHEWKLAQVRELLEEKRDKQGWQISYLGANVDAFAEGAALGIARGQSVNFAGAHTHAVMDSYVASNSRYVSRTNLLDTSVSNFTDEERESAMKGKKKGKSETETTTGS